MGLVDTFPLSPGFLFFCVYLMTCCYLDSFPSSDLSSGVSSGLSRESRGTTGVRTGLRVDASEQFSRDFFEPIPTPGTPHFIDIPSDF